MRVMSFSICVFLTAVVARAASIDLLDGSKLTGTIRLEKDGIVMQQDAASETKVSADQIQRVDFRAKPSEATTQNSVGLGALKGEYFLGSDFDPSKRMFIRSDFGINGSWDTSDNPFRSDIRKWVPFCVRWTGQIQPLYSEKYWFHLGPQYEGRIWIDHRLIVDLQAEMNTPITFEAGRKYDIRVDEVAANRSYTLMWESQSQPYSVVPASALSVREDDPDPAVVSRILSPADGSMLTGQSDLPVAIQVDAANRHIQRVELVEGTDVIQTLVNAPYQFTWHNVPGGEHILQARAFDELKQVWASVPAHLNVVGNNGGKLAEPWGEFNVGDSADSGNASGDNGSLVLTRSGGEVLVGNDKFQFVPQPLKGNGQIIAQLSDVHLDHPTKDSQPPVAGLMIRRSLAGNSEHAAILFSPGVGSIFLSRNKPDAAASSMTTTAKSPGYMRLTREGSLISGFASADGTSWEFLGSVEIDMPENVLVGLVLSSQNDGMTGSATFDHAAVKTMNADDQQFAGSGLRLVDGTLLNGWFRGYEKGAILLEMAAADRQKQRISIPSEMISRIIYRPVSAESLQGVGPDEHGVVLKNGDFLQGEITRFQGETLELESDIFGPRTFRARDVLAAILLRPVVAHPAQYRLFLRDGSTIEATSVRFVAGGVLVDTNTIKGLLFPADSLAELRQRTP